MEAPEELDICGVSFWVWLLSGGSPMLLRVQSLLLESPSGQATNLKVVAGFQAHNEVMVRHGLDLLGAEARSAIPLRQRQTASRGSERAGQQRRHQARRPARQSGGQMSSVERDELRSPLHT
jgi:hypothetical protein